MTSRYFQNFAALTFEYLQTYLWVLNNEEEFERAFQLGATGVMTDFPTKLKDYLQKHPEFQANGSDN